MKFRCGCEYEPAVEEDDIGYFPILCDKHQVRHDELDQILLNEVRKDNE